MNREVVIYTIYIDVQDALRPDRSSATHFGLPRVHFIFFTCVIPHLSLWWKFNLGFDFLKALEEVRKIQPKRTLFTGKFNLITQLLLKILH